MDPATETALDRLNQLALSKEQAAVDITALHSALVAMRGHVDTLTTQRMPSPSLPGLPTVFITSRNRSASVSLSAATRSPVRSMISRRKRSMVSTSMSRKAGSSASPDSSCSLSISSVRGRDSFRPCSS